MGIKRKTDSVISHTGIVALKEAARIKADSYVPNLYGLSKKELMPLFSISNIKIKINGEGRVIRQHPLPGTPLKDDMTLTVELE
jgi:hypothetical protein